jgi:hypothetical protein
MNKGSGDRPKASGDEGAPPNGDPFVLEQSFPTPDTLFEPHRLPPITALNVCIALDASAMLLPYKVNSASLAELGNVYEQLAKQKRLFIPARAAREFARNRNTQLGDLVHNLKQRREALSKLPPILAALPEFKDAADGMEAARSAYLKLEEVVKGWRGDDPVSSLYAKIFKETIVDLDLSKEALKQLESEKSRRYRDKVPPGYKDASKDDGGIGDFLIWKTLLLLGSKEKKIWCL